MPPPWKSGKYCTKGNTALMGTIKKCKIAFPDKSHESIESRFPISYFSVLSVVLLKYMCVSTISLGRYIPWVVKTISLYYNSLSLAQMKVCAGNCPFSNFLLQVSSHCIGLLCNSTCHSKKTLWLYYKNSLSLAQIKLCAGNCPKTI